jgi:hypothetical protein
MSLNLIGSLAVINMTFKKTLVLMLLFIVLGCAYLSTDFSTGFSSSAPKPPSQLELTGSKCADIAERSVANIIPIIEFQRLERASRKSNVLDRCMRDHGFTEQPAWLSYATPIASANAKQNNTSTTAALEDMRRLAMSRFTLQQNEPMYWRAKNEAK